MFIRFVTLLVISFAILELGVAKEWDDFSAIPPITVKENEKSGIRTQTQFFAAGVKNYFEAKNDEALSNFQESVSDNKFALKDYAYYFLGLTYQKLSRWEEAYKEFNKIVSTKEAGPIKISARYRMGESALEQKNYRLSEQNFRLLERPLKNSEKFPFILWKLAKVNILQKDIYKGCKYIRKLYAKFPAHELVSDWTLDLRAAKIDGLSPGCLATLEEQKQRIKNLQYAGESDRAKREIRALYEKTNELTKYPVDIIYARFLVEDGDVDEALKILLPYHSEKSGDVQYLMLLAKAAARKGESSLALGAYTKVHQMMPKRTVGREALYQAAFVSYLAQDYDGALLKFEDYKKKYGGKNGMTASWHIAWVRYLKGDYKGAYDMFDQFSKMRMSRKVRSQLFDPVKLSYWKNICLLKLGQNDQAIRGLEKIAQDTSVGYYAITARARLASMKVSLTPRNISSVKDKAEPEISAEIPVPEIKEDAVSEEAVDTDAVADSEEETKDEETEPAIAAAPETTGEESPDSILSGIKDPRLQVVFQKAEVLRSLGFDEWSNKELQYIETHTRNKTYLQSLIEKYEIGNSYSRSSYIAEVYYEGERRKGLNAANLGWRKAYPQAFEKLVGKYSDSFNISPSIVWGIMRTESFFKPQAKSNVGAMGLMQVMPLTATKMAEQVGMSSFKVNQLFDPDTNVKIGSKYIQRLSKMFDGHLPLVAASYNAGPHRVYTWMKNFGNLSLDEFIEHIPYNQTRGYAKKVVRSYYVYNSIYYPDELKKKPIEWLAQPAKINFNGPVPTKETWEAL